MKLPSLPKPKPKPKSKSKAAPKPKVASKRQMKLPPALDGLYRDMRDRRLLLPALLLVVAIVAVPIAFSAPKEPAPAPVAMEAPDGAAAVAPAVLTEQPLGVRDYRERLEDLKSKNPFASDFDRASEQTGNDSSVAGATTPDTTTPIAPPTNNDIGDIAGDEPPLPPAAPTDTTGDGAPSDDGGGDEVLILAPQIDVRTGPVGDRKRVKDVESGDVLPGKQNPIVMFLGAGNDLKYAHFAVASGVTETDGDGRCQPSRSSCQFLRLKEDQKQYFSYGPNEQRFSLKVTDIREEIVDRRKVEDK